METGIESERVADQIVNTLHFFFSYWAKRSRDEARHQFLLFIFLTRLVNYRKGVFGIIY